MNIVTPSRNASVKRVKIQLSVDTDTDTLMVPSEINMMKTSGGRYGGIVKPLLLPDGIPSSRSNNQDAVAKNTGNSSRERESIKDSV